MEIAATEVERGNRHLADRAFELAIDSYVKAIEIQPDLIEAHSGLCRVLLIQEKFDVVIGHLHHVLAVSPNFVPACNLLALAHLGAGDPLKAVEAAVNSLRGADTAEGRVLFTMGLQQAPAFVPTAPVRALALRALTEPWCRPSEIARFCVNAIGADAAVMAALAEAAAAPDGASPFRVLAGDRLLCGLLENACVPDATIERALTDLRRALLNVSPPPDDPATLAFACTLARQCFINEYAYAQTEAERTAVAALRERLVAALRDDDLVAPLSLTTFAAYMPLSALEEDERLLARRWPSEIEALLQQQVREPAEERRLRETIPRLTPIADDVSVMVRNQYEENPYPRWVKTVPTPLPATIDTQLAKKFPLAGFCNLDRVGPIDVLVAGCGTGQQIVDVTQGILDTRVLAVDLSLSSLAYAKRQTEALGLTKIKYGQADILELGALGRDFDVIYCAGVLHHLGDPLAGWRVLASLVRPNGVMQIALYSELARRHVVEARAFVADHGYPSTGDGIRAFRQDVLALPPDASVRRIAASPDFFSTSTCRDLVFHVQEHRFTLPQIKEFLAEQNLCFLCFDIKKRRLRDYRRLHGRNDPAMTDLDRWHAFEEANSSTFAGMYQFWVQKRA